MDVNIGKKKYKVNWVPSLIILLSVCLTLWCGLAILVKLSNEKDAIYQQQLPQAHQVHEENKAFDGEQESPKKLLEPYNVYPDNEGNIIREYKLFSDMEPTENSHSGHKVYFERKDFDDIINKYDLTSFPTRWTTNRENLYNLEYEKGNVKKKHGWNRSKANYQIIQTNKPDNTADMMTCDLFGYKHIWNKSDCYLNSCTNQNLKELLTFETEKTPYIRFCTKNLEVEFDWFALIATEFKTYMPLTSQAQENTAWAQRQAVEGQEYTAWTQENTAQAQYYTVRAQENINALKSTNQPKKISINLTNKTIPNYRTWGAQTVPYCEVNYDLQELVDFINRLDLSNNHHLQKIKQFVNEYT